MRASSIALLVLAACGSSSGTKQPDAPMTADTSTCSPGASCDTNPNAGCSTGIIACQGGQAVCVDNTAAADGTSCAAGVCTRGVCLAPVTTSSTIDVSTMALTPLRTCPESPAYSVTALTSTTATLSNAPDTGCLVAGDEIMLINLQGAPGATANVGNWELLDVASVSGTAVTFRAAKAKSYGALAGVDVGIGVATTDQKVALVRVAQFGALGVDSGGTITTGAWNGLVGGVIAIHASSVTLDGSISVAATGYRGGRWSQDDASCSENLATEAGESIDGPGAGGTSPNFGGAGGIGADSGKSFIGTGPLNSGASHATVGTTGVDAGGHTMGGPGATYGTNDASTLTLGSGESGNLTCSGANTTGPVYAVSDIDLAGGIIVVIAQTLTVNATGSINASAAQAARDTTASGGNIFIRGGTLSLGTARVTAKGGTAAGSGGNAGSTAIGGDGYIVVKGTVNGTTDPAAHQL